jgi:hypothetical protein
MRRFIAPLLLTAAVLALIAALADYNSPPHASATMVPTEYAREIDQKRQYTSSGYTITEGNTTTYYDTQGHFRGRTVIDGGAAHYYDHQNRYAGSIVLTNK